MTHSISDIAFTPAVKRMQERKRSRKGYARMEKKGGWRPSKEIVHIAQRQQRLQANCDELGE